MPRISPLLLLALIGLAAGPAFGGTCSNPTGNEADIRYNLAYHTYQFCNGTNWIPDNAGYSQELQSAFNPTYPAGSGFFVMSGGTYNGNLGGFSGANAICLSDLTTNTGWKGYSTAYSNGQLVSAKVYAFLCDFFGCNTNLMANTKYFFANAGNGSAGGASFTTDSNGLGPNDPANWSAANYFSGTYNYWSRRATTGPTQWANSQGGGANGGCNLNYSSTTGSESVGNSAFTGSNRWLNGNSASCSTAVHLICVVNP